MNAGRILTVLVLVGLLIGMMPQYAEAQSIVSLDLESVKVVKGSVYNRFCLSTMSPFGWSLEFWGLPGLSLKDGECTTIATDRPGGENVTITFRQTVLSFSQTVYVQGR